ncbi:MAG TPA: hypothetical protein VGK92_13365 [Gaiellales bacterium]|jgi:hypothetical protein
MRQRGQATVEAIALIAVALALAAALLLGMLRFAPPFTATLVRALSGVVAPGSQRAPTLDGLETALLDGATSPDADGPTLLDVRTHLRARLGTVAGDGAFLAVLRPLVARALPSDAPLAAVEAIHVIDAATEKAWLRAILHPDFMTQAAGVVVGSAGTVGGLYSVAKTFGLVEGPQPDFIAPGDRLGDVLVSLPLHRQIVLRRRAGDGLTVVDDRYAIARSSK